MAYRKMIIGHEIWKYTIGKEFAKIKHPNEKSYIVDHSIMSGMNWGGPLKSINGIMDLQLLRHKFALILIKILNKLN